MFGTASYIHPSLIFVDKAGAYQSGAHYLIKPLAYCIIVLIIQAPGL
jgi:hypothetical protein